jgi:hypothetical protein
MLPLLKMSVGHTNFFLLFSVVVHFYLNYVPVPTLTHFTYEEENFRESSKNKEMVENVYPNECVKCAKPNNTGCARKLPENRRDQ